MTRTSSVRRLLAGHTLHIAALAIAGLLAPLGACQSGGSAGEGGAGGYGAGAQQCAYSNEYAAVSVNLFNGLLFRCPGDTAFPPGLGLPLPSGSGGGSPDVAVEGVVRNVASGTFVVDSCHPNDNCAPMESAITLSGTDLSVSIPDGTFVQLQMHLYHYIVRYTNFCHLTVRNVPSRGSTPNPTSDGTFLWLAYHHAAGGYYGDYSVPNDPYQVKPEIVCEKPYMFYALRFSFPDAPGAEVVAPKGQTVTWWVPKGEHAGEYRVRNVEAYFDNDFVYNYWIARK